jgi:hypothetical protein
MNDYIYECVVLNSGEINAVRAKWLQEDQKSGVVTQVRVGSRKITAAQHIKTYKRYYKIYA